ncbi:D-lactate dehydrogenase (cytochrome) [Azospirillum lipoferum]|uniref:D-lactate dehydrogenase (cytochrome) n=1 Tax=Azospirillum lipoferum TaxID=193 RepID=A0A5A9G9F7_AZOLI|nr:MULTISPECIES: FAD-linked oxidase C-terminal domain-containing protein [Azospirillum]KAA0590354.1 FAD-binding protein [Azospirillum lipoferum]MCP1614763.1 D-lactate dehydrogenase (cytochrome) [Azospirillum lipoferum]MDW5532218.1 FAD-linked oxidase C-terminal domain-containing protein [Azospirillum sp. NL1]
MSSIDAATGRSPEPGDGVIRAVEALRRLLGPRLSTTMAERTQHSRGEGLPDVGMPDAIARPQTTDEVAAILRLCHEHRVPVVAFGAGTSLEGQVAAIRGGISVDLTGLDRVIDISADAMDCRVEAGVTRKRLNEELRHLGLFFPVDPGADATIGGMAGTRASGTNAVRYGTMRESVLGLTVVTPDGTIVRTGTRARKSAAGLDLTALYVGSEGTLGIVTEIQLRLQPIPEAILAAVCSFRDLTGAVSTAVAALQSGLRMARIELLDEVQMDACIAYSKLDYPRGPALFLEFHGSKTGVREDAETFGVLAADYGGGTLIRATETESRNRLWKARHDAYHAVMALAPGKANMGTDACVPISALVDCLLETKADVEASGLVAPIVGHVGDGNFHLGILFDPNDDQERLTADALARRVGLRAIAFGGTCSGEHGIGIHKLDQMETQHGPALDLMRRIKVALDPEGIMNPGKLIPDA